VTVEQGARTVRFNCVLCGATCGMIATVDGEKILDVSGDRDHPVSRGFTCAKGRSIAGQHHGARRLERPRLRGEDVEWDVLLDDLAAGMQRALDRGGPDRIATFRGTAGIDAASLFTMPRFQRGIGTRQIYSPVMLDVGNAYKATELITGFAYHWPMWMPDDPEPTLVVLVGVNPPASGGYNGVATSNWPDRLRSFRGRGGEVWVVDPRKTRTAHQGDRHLAPRAGTDVFLFAWLVRELLAGGFDAYELETACHPEDVERLRAAVASFDLDAVATRTGLAPSDLVELLAAIRRHRKVAIMPGTGVSFQQSGVLAYWLIWAAMIVTGSLDREGGVRFLPPARALLEPDSAPLEGHAPEDGAFGPGPNSRPDLVANFGQLPAIALVDEIEAGEIDALLILGGNPLAAAPRPDRLRAALGKLDVFAVLDTFENELTEMATHVIPCTWITERPDFWYIPVAGVPRAYSTPALVPPGADRRHSWWVLGQLGRRLGIDVLDGLDLDTVDAETVVRHAAHASCDWADEVLQAGSEGVEVPTRYGWLHEKVLPGGRWRVAPRPLVDRLARVWDEGTSGVRLVSGRVVESVNSAHYARNEPPPIHLSTDAAEAHGIATGDRVRVSTALGAIEGWARVDDTLASQSIWVTQGWLGQNVNQLTDPWADHLTGMPTLTGFPVQLERVDAPSAGSPVPANQT
jgi:anaerobic selenocysteine-containing dehydrogenase